MAYPVQERIVRPVVIIAETKVAGLFHNPQAHHLASSLQPGDVLTLARDYRNPYDRWAVSVHCPNGAMLGYVSCDVAETVGRLCEGGRSLHGEVLACDVLRAGARVTMAVILDD